MNWIKTSEKYPENGDQVLVIDIYGFIYLATHEYFSFQILTKEDGELIETVARFVTYWMPLPQPPEE